MKLEECNFKTRGDLLEAAELLNISPSDDIPEDYEALALMMSSLESFDPSIIYVRPVVGLISNAKVLKKISITSKFTVK